MTLEPQEPDKESRNWLIYIGLAFVIVAGLLIITGQPANALEQFNMSLPGERNTGDWFQFTVHNISGRESVTHHFTVYSSKMLDQDEPYQYWSVYFGQWLNQTPGKGKKWLFVWVEDWIDGTPTWGYNQNKFLAWVWGNTTVLPDVVQMQDITVRADKHLAPAVILQADDHPVPRGYSYFGGPYGWKDGFIQPRIEPGESNAWSGWIMYQVPGSALLQDIRVAGWFMNWGTAYWNLAPRAFIQVSPTPTIPPVVRPVQQAINRISERPGSQVINGRQRA